MSQIKVNAVTDASGGNTATINSMTPTADSLQGFRNRLINGSMMIDQRNAGASVTPSNSYTLDRWVTYSTQASKFTVQRNAGSVTPPTGFTNYLGVTSSSAYSITSSDYFSIVQRIEGYNVSDLGFGSASATTVTISFWVRSSLTGTFGGNLTNSAFDRSYPFSYTISTANTWEKKTITATGDTTGTWLTTTGSGLELQFGLGVGSTYSGTAGAWTAGWIPSVTGAVSVVGTNGATWYITGVQLEVGSVATPFERRDYGRELAMCQRYFIVLANGATHLSSYWSNACYYTSTEIYGTINLPVTMRTTPTTGCTTGTNYYTFYRNGGTDGINSITFIYSNPQNLTWNNTAQASGTAGQAGQIDVSTSSSFIAASAEL